MRLGEFFRGSLARAQFAKADSLFAAMQPTDSTQVGQIRAKIGQRQLSLALAFAAEALAQHPVSALLTDGLAEVRYARGELDETLAALNKAIALDPCLARSHYDLSLYLELSGMSATSQKELDLAYHLAPGDPLIRHAWKATQEPVPTPDSEITDLRAIADRPETDSQKKSGIERLIKVFQADKKGDCELVSGTPNATIPLVTLFADGKQMPPTGSALDMVMNGKMRRLLLDSGATGLLISRDAAEGLGLVPEADVESSGVGDGSASHEYITHVERIAIGSLVFRSCEVRVQAQHGGLDAQGLFGIDTLRSLLVTLDFPAQQLRTAALPLPNGDVANPVSMLTIAGSKRDRYEPPGMESWTPAFRESQNLLLQTLIGKVPRTLFIMDTGAGDGLIDLDVATEVTHVTTAPGVSMRGVSGTTNSVSDAGPMTVEFPGFTGRVTAMTALDLARFTLKDGVKVSGFIGYNILRNLVIDIDYRDNLIRFTQRSRMP
jgi:hypothetical protein